MGKKPPRIASLLLCWSVAAAGGTCALAADNVEATAALTAAVSRARPPVMPDRTNVVHQPEDIVARACGRELRWADMDQAAHNLMNDDVDARATFIPKAQEEEALQFYRRKAVTTFINRTLLFEETRRRGITVTPADRSNGMSKVEALLRPRGDRTLEDLFADPQYGAAMRRDFEESLYVEKLLDEAIRLSMKVEESDREAGVKEVTARRAEGRRKIDALRTRLLEGADFAALAKEQSDHPSKNRGGDIGEFPRGKVNDPAIEEAAFNQATNAIGPVLETKLGYAVLQVTGRRPAEPAVGDAPAKPETVRARIILSRAPPLLTRTEIDRMVKRRKYEAAYKELLNTLRRGATIESIY